MILSFLPAAPTLWHSAQVTAACAPVSGNLVFLCLAMVNRERCQSASVWQPSQRFSKGAFANWRSCGSLWQFATCTDCHKDPHDRQFAKAPFENRCEGCHTVADWHRALFTIAKHRKIKHPLTGAHDAD